MLRHVRKPCPFPQAGPRDHPSLANRPSPALIPNLSSRFLEHDLPRLSLGESSGIEKTKQADNMPVSKKQTPNLVQIGNGSGKRMVQIVTMVPRRKRGCGKRQKWKIAHFPPRSRIWNPSSNSPEIRSELSRSPPGVPSLNCALNHLSRLESTPHRKCSRKNRGS